MTERSPAAQLAAVRQNPRRSNRMLTLEEALPQVRNSVCALMRIFRAEEDIGQVESESQELRLGVSFAGTAWCIVENSLVVSAFHVLNGGKERNPEDRFHIFSVPDNGPFAYHFPVVSFPHEDGKSDLAILELGNPTQGDHVIPAVPITFKRPADGSHVLTIGFPSPEIASANVSPNGDYLGGQFFLKAHANEGVVAAQYEFLESWFYEFNVGWHHGESGGPVISLDTTPAVFSIMQHYRNVHSPHGILPGPHRGISLEAMKVSLLEFGAKEV
ncbi:MAG: trypsin-like peptidase domain-containing protein [Anaerolineales bacterium]